MDVGKYFPDYKASHSRIAFDMQRSILFYGHAEWRHVPWTRRAASSLLDMQSGFTFVGHASWHLVLSALILTPQKQNRSVNYSTASYVTVNFVHNTSKMNLSP
jgi:hypothetical protein